jgi:hypothetical protein
VGVFRVLEKKSGGWVGREGKGGKKGDDVRMSRGLTTGRAPWTFETRYDNLARFRVFPPMSLLSHLYLSL